MLPLPPPLSLDQLTGPPLGFRFAVFFLARGVLPNPLDIRFQRVSGISATIETRTVDEGGQNLYSHRLPKKIGYSNLILERGFVVGSQLNLEFELAMSLFKFTPSNVLVTLLGETAIPLAGWLFVAAYPVRWATADLLASSDQVLIDTLELAYTRMQPLRL
jgi:phage tail-like protein